MKKNRNLRNKQVYTWQVSLRLFAILLVIALLDAVGISISYTSGKHIAKRMAISSLFFITAFTSFPIYLAGFSTCINISSCSASFLIFISICIYWAHQAIHIDTLGYYFLQLVFRISKKAALLLIPENKRKK